MTQAVQSMRQCILDRIETLREHLRIALAEWIQDGGDLSEAFVDEDASNATENVAAAWGYLEGVADAEHLTVLEMLDAYDVDISARPKPARKARKPRNPCPKCGGKTHRCRTGECRHCDSEACGHAWRPKKAKGG